MTSVLFDATTLPAYWAPALINDDWSGLDETESALCQRAVDELAALGWEVVDVERDPETGEAVGSWFTWRYDQYLPAVEGMTHPRGGDVMGYIIRRI